MIGAASTVNTLLLTDLIQATKVELVRITFSMDLCHDIFIIVISVTKWNVSY